MQYLCGSATPQSLQRKGERQKDMESSLSLSREPKYIQVLLSYDPD